MCNTQVSGIREFVYKILAGLHGSYKMCWLLVDAKRVKLLRYNDPVLGPRKLPHFENLTNEKSVIEAGDTFTVDTDNNVVMLQHGSDSNVAVGTQLVYVINSWDWIVLILFAVVSLRWTMIGFAHSAAV